MSIYGSLHVQAVTAVAAISAVVTASITVRRRKKPVFVQQLDTVPCIVVATREDLCEQNIEETFGNNFFGGYELYVGALWNGEWADSVLDARLDLREAIRLALWRDDLFTDVGSVDPFRVNYTPNPPVPRSGWANTDEDWQLFTAVASGPSRS